MSKFGHLNPSFSAIPLGYPERVPTADSAASVGSIACAPWQHCGTPVSPAGLFTVGCLENI